MQGQGKEEIVIIGGGLGGCLTALMLAKNPKYHVTLIEQQDTLLNGASAIASRLHLGGEYPLDQQTAHDCLMGAVIWKLLMPKDIYTPTPPMKFLVAENTEKYGRDHQDDPKALTLDKYMASYEKVRQKYEEVSDKIGKALGLDEANIKNLLFGSAKEGEFFRPLDKHEYTDYTKIAGGFQSQELGLNVPKYLAMISAELEAEYKKGNITILTKHQVEKDGIEAQEDKFIIHCKGNRNIEASQVIQAAWQGGPELTQLGAEGKKAKGVTVSKRAMLLVDLPRGFKTPPAFVMLGDDGGMLAPYNDKVALCYLPPNREEIGSGGYGFSKPAAYIKDHLLTDKKPSLPSDWNSWDEPMKFLGGYLKQHPGLIPEFDVKKQPDWKALSPEKKWTKVYFELLKKRFPVLKNATNPRLVIRDTLNFQKDIHFRRHEAVEEAEGAITEKASMAISQRQAMLMEMLMTDDMRPVILEDEEKKGLFTLYPTKATYTVQAALQAVAMVNERSQRNKDPKHPLRDKHIEPEKDVLNLILVKKDNQEYDIGATRRNMDKFSLAHMKEPDERFYARFFRQHPDLDPKIMVQDWPMEQKGDKRWTNEPLHQSSRGR